MLNPPGPRPAPATNRAATVVEDHAAPTGGARARAATIIESDDREPPAAAKAAAAEPSRPVERYRPRARPSTATLTAYDDGSDEGEVLRIRGDRFVIGRTDGDFLLPHDGRVSSRHVEIARKPGDGADRWVVTDLRSTNGLFVRVRRALLTDGSEFLAGDGRYRFDAPGEAPPSTPVPARGQTLGWGHDKAPPRLASLVEMIGSEEGGRVVLSRPEYWLGGDPSCEIRRADDPFCEPRHLRLHRTPAGEWMAENNRSRNGLWLRLERVEVEGMVFFQAGEQRFRLQVQ